MLKIIEKTTSLSTILSKKSKSLEFFLGRTKIEKLYIVYSPETHNRKLIEFL